MICCGEAKRELPRYFCVGPVRDMGDSLPLAVRHLGGDPRRHYGNVQGWVLADGPAYLRLPATVSAGQARTLAADTKSRLGAAVALVDGQVLFRDVGRERVSKALDPRSEAGFLKIVDRIARDLRRSTREHEPDAVRRAIERLDVDWPNLDDGGRRQVISAANQALAGLGERIIPGVKETLGVEANQVVRGTKSSLQRSFGIDIQPDFSARDGRVAEFVEASQTNFIRKEFERRASTLSSDARKIVADGVKQGLGRSDITDDLVKAYQGTITSRNRSYWEVVASAFVNRARSFAEVSAYADAGIEVYRILAVGDEATTPICLFLNGKRFSVARAVDRFDQTERLRDPARIKAEQPWLRLGRDSRGNSAIVVSSDDGPVPVARVSRKDDGFSLSRGASASRLQDLKIGPPPYHGLCRTTTVPEV